MLPDVPLPAQTRHQEYHAQVVALPSDRELPAEQRKAPVLGPIEHSNEC